MLQVAQRLAVETRRISASGRRLTVNIGTFPVISKDAGLVLHPSFLPEGRMQHDTAFPAGSQYVVGTGFEREIQAVFRKVGFHAERHFEFPGTDLDQTISIEIDIRVFPRMPFVIAADRFPEIALEFVFDAGCYSALQCNPCSCQIEGGRRLRQRRDDCWRIPYTGVIAAKVEMPF